MRDVDAGDYGAERLRPVPGVVQPGGIAGIFSADGDMFVTTGTPYERELMFEHVDLCAKRYGRVRLSLDRQEYTVALCQPDGQTCDSCHRLLDNSPAYARRERVLCGRCARRDLV